MKNALLVFCLIFGAAASIAQTPVASPAAAASPDGTAEKARADRAEARLKDWPNFSRYRDANAALAAPAKDEQRVVFMGDSITDSWKLAEYFPGKPYVNRGISGQTTSQMLLRTMPDAVNLKPKVMVVLAGTNDIAGNTGPITPAAIEDNFKAMTTLADAAGIKVVLASILPISDYNTNKEGRQIVRSAQRPPEQIVALNNWLKKFAAEKGHIYLDYFSAMADDKGFLKAELAGDGLHPNARGYEVMKPLAQQAIEKALEKVK